MESRRILIVEDETIVAEDITRILTKNKYEVIDVISSGTAAVTRIRSVLPDLILMDIMLEDKVTGIDVANQVLDLNIPVVFLTAYADDTKIEKAKLIEPFGYLIKPFRERELIATLEMALYKHQMDSKLRQSFINYQRIFENIQDIFFEVTTKGSITQLSPSIEEHFSYTAAELIGTDVQYLFASRDVFFAFLAKLTKEKAIKNYPLRFKDLDNSYVSCLCSAKLIYDKTGKEAKIIGSLRDITENLEIKKNIEKSEIKYKKLFDTQLNAMVLYDKNKLIECNEITLEMLGLSHKSLIFETQPEEFSPQRQPNGKHSKDLIKFHTNNAFQKGSDHFFWTFRKANGQNFSTEVWLSAIELNGHRMIQGTIKDLSQLENLQTSMNEQHSKIEMQFNRKIQTLEKQITDLKKDISEKEKIISKAHENDTFNQTLFDNIPVETIVVNKNGEIVRYNLAVKKNRSHPPEIGSIMYKDYASKHKDDLFGEMIDSIQSGKSRHFPELQYKEKIWDITMAPYEHGAIISSQNISAQKHAEAQIMQLNGVFEKIGADSRQNIDLIVKETCSILNVNCSIFNLLENDTNNNIIFSSSNLPTKFCEKENFRQTLFNVDKLKFLVVANLEKLHDGKLDTFVKTYGWHSLMSYPIFKNKTYLGSLTVLDINPREFSEQEKHIISTLGKVISIEIERMQIADSQKQISLMRKMMLNAARNLNSSLDFQEVARRISLEAMELLNAYGSAVYLLDEDGETLRPSVVIDPQSEKEIRQSTLNIHNSFTGKSILNKRVMVFNDAGINSNGYQIPGTSYLENERIMVAPLSSDEEVFGAICLNKIGTNFSSDDMQILEMLANHATTALKNAVSFKKLQHEMQERIQAEQQRDNSIQELHSLQENLPVGVFRATPDNKITSVNKSFIHMFGYSSEKEIKKVSLPLLFDQTAPDETIRQALLKEGAITDLEIKLKRLDKSTFWGTISIKAIFDKDGKFVYQDGIVVDITKRKITEQTLFKTQMRLASLFNSVPDIILFETGGSKEFISENVKEFLGYSADEFMQNSQFYFSLIHQDDVEYVQNKYREWLQKGRPGILTLWCRIKKSNGEYIWVEDRRVETTDQNGSKYESGVRIDISNLKNAEEELKKSYEKLQNLLGETVNGLVSAVEMRDPYTAGHQRRVAALAVAIAEKMDLPKKDIEGLYLASLVHDIGKINVPAEILSKPGRLTTAEFNLIKTHPQSGYDILKSIEFPWPVAEIVLQHQERYDGSSYPQGLKGEEINLCARILCVADVMEAMSSHRPYRPSLGISVAIEEITKNRGILYDPTAVDACLNIFENDGFSFPEDE
ncbi:MAG TPA: PAS domain S-box protein [Candidatus Cloacimonadota bacterium]|nr:PAS domain S-box protein [Candidatus Cloacimonadota bacterium]